LAASVDATLTDWFFATTFELRKCAYIARVPQPAEAQTRWFHAGSFAMLVCVIF
jgi:hypothetical protein